MIVKTEDSNLPYTFSELMKSKLNNTGILEEEKINKGQNFILQSF